MTITLNPRYAKTILALLFVFMAVASCNGEQYTDPYGDWYGAPASGTEHSYI